MVVVVAFGNVYGCADICQFCQSDTCLFSRVYNVFDAPSDMRHALATEAPFELHDGCPYYRLAQLCWSCVGAPSFSSQRKRTKRSPFFTVLEQF